MVTCTANLPDVKEAVCDVMESAMGALASKIVVAVSGAVENALRNMQPPTWLSAQFAPPFLQVFINFLKLACLAPYSADGKSIPVLCGSAKWYCGKV